MFIISDLEGTGSQASVELLLVVVQPCDLGLVHHLLGLAGSIYWAPGGPPSTVASRLGLLRLVLLGNFQVMLGYNLAHVWHAFVGNLNSVSVEDFLKGVEGEKAGIN